MIKLLRRLFCKYMEFFCNHKDYYCGWWVQNTRFKKCKRCGHFEVEDGNGFVEFDNSREINATIERS